MVDNSYQTMLDRKVKKIPGMIAGGEKKKKSVGRFKKNSMCFCEENL